MTPTLAYLRVSDPRQATEDKSSLDQQRADILALAGRLGVEVDPAGWYVEPGFSAGTADRPAFRALIAYCEAHPRPAKSPGLILCYKDDRWGRFDDPADSTYWRQHVKHQGWLVRFTQDEVEGSMRHVIRALHEVRASDERQTIKDRARRGVRGAASKGLWCAKAPFGYRRLATDPVTHAERILGDGQRKGPNERMTLTPGPEREVALVRWLFTRYASGTRTLESLLQDASSIYPRVWNRRTLHHMLMNPAYCGDIVWGRRETRDRVGPGRAVARDAHPALVDRATWDEVQRLLTRNRTARSPVPGGYPLSGLIHCATCGHPFVGGGTAGPRGADRSRYRFYRDQGYRRTPKCPGRMMTIIARALEPEVVDAVARVIESVPMEQLIRAAFDRVLRASTGDQDAERAMLERERAADQARLDRLTAAIADGLLAKHEAESQVRVIRERMRQTTAALERFRFDAERATRLVTEREKLVTLALDFRARAMTLEGTELRELLRAWIQSATIDKDAMMLTLDVRPLPVLASGAPIDPLFNVAGPAEQEVGPTTFRTLIPLKTRSEWATEREARRRKARRAS